MLARFAARGVWDDLRPRQAADAETFKLRDVSVEEMDTR